MVSDRKPIITEKEAELHIGRVNQGLGSGQLDEDAVENDDKRNFVFNMDNGNNWGIKGAYEVSYDGLVSRGDTITM